MTFFFKIDVNFPQLLYFVVLAAVNAEYWRFQVNNRGTFTFISFTLTDCRFDQVVILLEIEACRYWGLIKG